MRIHQMLVQTRWQLGLTQVEMSDALKAQGMPYEPTTISDYERGRRPAPLAYIAALARYADLNRDPRKPTPPILQAVCTECPVGCAIEAIGERKSA